MYARVLLYAQFLLGLCCHLVDDLSGMFLNSILCCLWYGINALLDSSSCTTKKIPTPARINS